MYEELVKRLRTATTLPVMNTLCQEAADAIEELQQTAEHYHGCMNEWFEAAQEYEAAVPKWIPVTERLPDLYTWVLVCTENHEVAFDAFYDGTRWKDAVMNGLIVTHWMSLPTPPKEE